MRTLTNSEDEISVEGEDEAAVGLQVMPSVIYKQSQVAVKYLRSLMGAKVFDNPKDHEVLARLIGYCSGGDRQACVLDFFAGSCSTSEAVMLLNGEDGGKRRFIMIQLPEPIDAKTAGLKAGYRTIADLGRARIKRAGERINSERASELDLQGQVAVDLGFKAYSLSRSNFKVWEGDISDVELGEQIEMHVDHLSKASSPEDVLYELLLKSGFPLTTKVKSTRIVRKGSLRCRRRRPPYLP